MGKHALNSAVLAVIVLGLSGCGGGSSGSDSGSSDGGSDRVVNSAPVVSNIKIKDTNTGNLYVRDELTVSHQYSDTDNDLEGESIVRWLVEGEQVATGTSYTTSLSDAGKSVVVEIEPVAKTGTLRGVAVKSVAVIPQARNFMLFDALDIEGKRATWTTDGTSEGTTLLANFNDQKTAIELADVIDFGDKKILSIKSDSVQKMAVTDGTSEGTVIFNDNGLDKLWPIGFTAFKDRVYFSGVDAENGRELWATDGTQAGTVLVRNIAFGNLTGNQPHSGAPDNLTVLNGILYFNAYTAATGSEIWSSKGTAGETQLLEDLNVGFFGSSPTDFYGFGSKLIYTAESNSFTARGVYAYDQSKDTHERLHKGFLDRAKYFSAYNDKVFFVSDAGRRGWLSDGTTAGTQALTMPSGRPSVFQSIVFKNSLYVATSNGFYKLNDNTNTFEIVDASLNNVASVQKYNGALFMSAKNTEIENIGAELYRFDGSAFSLVKDIAEGPANSDPYDLYILNDHMIFTAQNEEMGRELWITDGTTAGTRLLVDINADAASSNPLFCYRTSCR